MEQKEKIEKPRWVELVEALPEAARQTVGNLCAQTLQNLAVLDLISTQLMVAIYEAAHVQTLNED